MEKGRKKCTINNRPPPPVVSNSRKNIRLDKKLSPINVWSLALGCIIGWGAYVMPANTFLMNAGPLGTAAAFFLAALIMIIIALNYDFMINRYPLAGGEFTYTHRAFGEKHAFICSWFLALSYLAIVPLNATALALIGRNLMHNIFQVGFHYTAAGYDVYAGEIALAVSALLIFAYLSIRGVKFTGIFQTLLVIALVGGVMIVTISAILSPDVKISGISPLFAPGISPSAGILAVIAVAPWAFVGFDTVPQAAEEFNFSPRKTKAIMIIAIIFGAAVYVVLNTVTAMVIPEGYTSWPEYISDAPKLTGIMSLPTFHAGYKLLGEWGLVFLGISVLGAILSGITGFYMATSRLLYSMPNEKVIPEWFGKIHAKYKTPYNAVIFVMIVSVTAPFFGRTALGWIVDMSSIGAAIGYGYTSLAAYKFARSEGNTAIMITGVLGFILSLIFAVLLLVPLPDINASLGKEPYICLIVWITAGIFFYIKTRKK